MEREPIIKLFVKSGCKDWVSPVNGIHPKYDHFVCLTADDAVHKATFIKPTATVPMDPIQVDPFVLPEKSKEEEEMSSFIMELLRDPSKPSPMPLASIPKVKSLSLLEGMKN